ncbi:MAG: polysaccharide/polyol phosphate ABC transporter ATP-binding protein [Pseudanabaena sp.]|nr:MAG: polysaccharide/polyol phosphate ABC transporter ATP-binding protein [Pseudanabaena sp.]
MSDAVIRVENLSKKYIIGHQQQERYTALRDVVANGVKNFTQGLIGKRDKDLEDIAEDFWALKDVSFEIKQGDRVGIIGRNGAGKSTLLKILSRITEPTSGKISIKGRVASLLEVGTGFHPELTGRENVYLNGAILGMDRIEIKKKFDEIVAFAEVEKFLDTPVKRYSSGMYVRLAFAVAAHLEPEILIVDEVLAVGDAQFQKKCLGKMEDVGREGRTVLFVSHNMAAIRNLCLTGIYLDSGKLNTLSRIDQVIDIYNSKSYTNQSTSYHYENTHKESPHFVEISIVNPDQSGSFTNDESIFILLSYFHQNIKNLVISLHIYNSEDVEAIHSSSEFNIAKEENLDCLNVVTKKIAIPNGLLNVGIYKCKFVLGVRNVCIYDTVESVSFEIVAPKVFVPSTSPSDWKGIISPNLVQWS